MAADARDRAAAILILVFGQQAENIARLTWDDVTITEELVTIQLGTIHIALPDPLDRPWRELAANPGHSLTASHPNTNWVFRGTSPGRHIHPGHLTQRLSELFSTRAARLGTLHELTKLAPVAIIAETLGYSPTTIEHHALDSAAPKAPASYLRCRLGRYFLDDPAVAVRIAEVGESETSQILGFADGGATAEKFCPCRLHVRHHQLQAFEAARDHTVHAGSDDDRTG